MTTPDGWDRIQVEAVDALRAEADTWRQGADELREARTAAADLTLGQQEMSTFATWCGLTDLYQQLQDRLLHLLTNSASHLEKISAALTKAAANYEAEEMRRADALAEINTQLASYPVLRDQNHE